MDVSQETIIRTQTTTVLSGPSSILAECPSATAVCRISHATAYSISRSELSKAYYDLTGPMVEVGHYDKAKLHIDHTITIITVRMDIDKNILQVLIKDLR
jgi:hypothetical protein